MFKDACVFIAGAFIGICALLAWDYVSTVEAQNDAYERVLRSQLGKSSLDLEY